VRTSPRRASQPGGAAPSGTLTVTIPSRPTRRARIRSDASGSGAVSDTGRHGPTGAGPGANPGERPNIIVRYQRRLPALTTRVRQRALGRSYLTAIIDAHVLQRCVGSAAVMAEQCAHLLTMAARSDIALHVVPEGTNVGLWGAFDIAARDNAFTVRFETLEDVTGRAPETVSKALQAYERILGASLPRADSLDFTREMESQWKTRT